MSANPTPEQYESLQRAADEAARRVDQLERIMLIVQRLSSTFDLDALLKLIMSSAVEIMRAGAGTLFLLDEATGDMVFRAVTSADTALIGTHIPAGKGLVGRAGQGHVVIVKDVEKNHEFYGALENSSFQTKSLMAVPMQIAERTIGVLELINRQDGSYFEWDDTDFALTFAAQAALVIERVSLHQVEMVKQRMESELNLARELQAGLIPRQTPHITGWEFAGWWLPAHEVSGDFYDFGGIASGKDMGDAENLSIVIADVSDKGMHAALFMALTRSVIRAIGLADRTPAERLAAANHLICADAADGMFVTLFYALLDPAGRRMTCVNCGHNPPLLRRATTGALESIKRTGLVLGLIDGSVFEQVEVEFQPGDCLLMYTDGVTEAFGPDSELFGVERLAEIFKHMDGQSADQIMQGLQAAIHAFTGSAPQSDDITVVIARCVG
jgi:sigma-B regulation protein RsbU (phosphoserine phosphatase)